MPRIFQPARFPSGEIPQVQSMFYTTGQTFKKGAVLIYNAGGSGAVEEGGADPTPIVGVALEPAGSKPGFDAANSPTVFTGRVQEVSVAKADAVTIWSGRGVNGATDPVIPLLTHINESYGLLKTAAGEWVIDFAETVNTRLMIIDIDVDNNIFFFKWLAAQLAQP